MTGIRAVFVGGPNGGRVQDFPNRPDVVKVIGIDFREAVPLPEQTVTTETGVYERTYAERTIEWRRRLAIRMAGMDGHTGRIVARIAAQVKSPRGG